MMRAVLGSQRLCDAATLAISTILLCSAAIYNGYPIVWPDTGGYLELVNQGYRSVFYNMFVFPAHWTSTLWPVVLAQSVLMSYLLRLAMREAFGIVSRTGFVGIVAALCLVSSLPWYTGFLMADIFAPMLPLAFFLMIFCTEWLTRWENWFVRLLALLSATVHLSHLPIAFGLVAAASLVLIVSPPTKAGLVLHLSWPWVVVGAGTIAMFLANYLTLGIWTYSADGYAFQLARLVEDGQAVAFLNESCGTRHYKLCNYLDRLPIDEESFIWRPQSPFWAVGGFTGERDEGRKIIGATIARYPLWTARSALLNAFAQLRSNNSSAALFPCAAALSPCPDRTAPKRQIASFYPGDMPAFLNSRQNHDQLLVLRALLPLHRVALAVSAIYCFAIAILFAIRRQWLPLAMIASIGLAMLLNAFVTGAFSQPSHRYGSRIAWLIPFAALASWREVLERPQPRIE